MRMQKTLATLAIGLAVVLTGTSARAETVAGSGEIDGFVGYYSSSIDAVDEDVSYGIRFGWNVSDALGIDATVSHFETTQTILGKDFDLEANFVDLSVRFSFNPESRAVGYVFGGAGAVFDEDWEDEELTANVGGGLKIYATDSFFIRVDARARWFEDRDDDEFDYEGQVGFGFAFGG